MSAVTHRPINHRIRTFILTAQHAAKVCAVIDPRFDVVQAAATGIDTGRLLVSRPDTAEQGVEIAETLVRSGACDLTILSRATKADKARLVALAKTKGVQVVVVRTVRDALRVGA